MPCVSHLVNKQLWVCSEAFLHSFGALSVSHKLHKGIPGLGLGEVREGRAAGDVQRESIPGLLTTIQVLNRAFGGPFRQSWLPLCDCDGVCCAGNGDLWKCCAQSLFGVCPDKHQSELGLRHCWSCSALGCDPALPALLRALPRRIPVGFPPLCVRAASIHPLVVLQREHPRKAGNRERSPQGQLESSSEPAEVNSGAA